MRVWIKAGGGAALLVLAVSGPLQAQAWTTFYSAYQDGLDALKRGDPALAAKAFRRATALAPAPGNRVKTYGLNFLNAYHPYLKLAEAGLAAGDLSLAEGALKESATWAVEPQDQREALRSRLRSAQLAAAPKAAPAAPQPQPQTAQAPAAAAPAPVMKPAETLVPASSLVTVTTVPKAEAKPSRPEPVPSKEPVPAPATAVPAPSSPATVTAAPGLVPQDRQPDPAQAPAPAPPSWRKWAGLSALAASLGAAWLALKASRKPKARAQTPTTSGTPFPFAFTTTGSTQALSPKVGRPIVDDNLERSFGPWVAKRVLGTGGCGTAYYGLHAETGEEVAIKVPHRHLLQNDDFVARFHREAALGTVLDHPRIVRILDPGPPDGEPWLIMPFVNGVTLESYLQQTGALPIPQAIHLATDVAEAIAYAHTKGIVHRDLKPANIMVSGQGAVIMDLGIARVLDSGKHTSVYLGTPTYSAPEAMQNPSVGPPADRYALGIIIFEMLTGAPPFSGANAFKLLEAHAFEALPDLAAQRPLVPPRLLRLTQRLCDKKPEERPEDGETTQILRELKAEFPCDQY